MAKIRIKKYAGGGNQNTLGEYTVYGQGSPYMQGLTFNPSTSLDNIELRNSQHQYDPLSFGNNPLMSNPELKQQELKGNLNPVEMFNFNEQEEIDSDYGNVLSNLDSEGYKDVLNQTKPKNKIDWSNVGGEALRYSPAIISGARALFGDFEPEEVNLARYSAPEKITPEQISETRYNPLFDSQYNKLRGDIINTSGGSGAAARANLQAAGMTTARAKADMINKIVDFNLGQRSKADYYNTGQANQVGQMNTQVANQESLMNEQNRAAASDAKYNAWNDFIGSLSGIGTEMFRNKAIAETTPNVGQ